MVKRIALLLVCLLSLSAFFSCKKVDNDSDDLIDPFPDFSQYLSYEYNNENNLVWKSDLYEIVSGKESEPSEDGSCFIELKHYICQYVQKNIYNDKAELIKTFYAIALYMGGYKIVEEQYQSGNVLMRKEALYNDHDQLVNSDAYSYCYENGVLKSANHTSYDSHGNVLNEETLTEYTGNVLTSPSIISEEYLPIISLPENIINMSKEWQ